MTAERTPFEELQLRIRKPPRGESNDAREARRAESRGRERLEKGKVRRRDLLACHGYCRWPGCSRHKYLEVAHLEHKGKGGDILTIRSVAEKMIQVCQIHHKGANGIDTGDKEVRPLTAAGTAGPCEFWALVIDRINGQPVRRMARFAYEITVGVYRMDPTFTESRR